MRLASPSSAATAVRASARVFGVKSVSPAVEVAYRGLEELVEKAAEFFGDRVRGRVFRVRARRSGVEGFTSKDVERLLGRLLLERGARGVDLENPEYTAYVEVRGAGPTSSTPYTPAPGGFPWGVRSRA